MFDAFNSLCKSLSKKQLHEEREKKEPGFYRDEFKLISVDTEINSGDLVFSFLFSKWIQFILILAHLSIVFKAI